MDFADIFKATVSNLMESKTLPICEWLPWEFLPPKVQERGDLCSFTVLRTVMKANKTQNAFYNPCEWCDAIIESLPKTEEISEVSAENGIINIRLVQKAQTPLQPVEPAIAMQPIGFISSCFSEKFGTPRQSFYSKYSRGEITLLNHVNADSLDGLEDFSHIWLIFVFHKSTHSKLKSKVKPPRLNGEKKGIFATRTPHRYNPIGLSLCKIMRIEGKKILVSGIDLIDETPILDIKPYHPADNLNEFSIPGYIKNPIYIYDVEFHEYALERVRVIKEKYPLKFYTPEEDWIEIIREVLSQDPSTVHTKLKHQDQGLYAFKIDHLYVVYVRHCEKSSHLVVNVIHHFEAEIHELRTEAWLADMKDTLISIGVLKGI